MGETPRLLPNRATHIGQQDLLRGLQPPSSRSNRCHQAKDLCVCNIERAPNLLKITDGVGMCGTHQAIPPDEIEHGHDAFRDA
jgi:hypothetical protein